MLRTYENIHSNQEIAAKRLCFSAAMVTFNPMTVISSMNSPASSPILLSSFSESELVELENYLRTYTEKPAKTAGRGDGLQPRGLPAAVPPGGGGAALLRRDQHVPPGHGAHAGL